jgi:hypothetical protein
MMPSLMRTSSRWFLSGFLLLVSRCGAAEVEFVRDIQPLLKEHCYKCHGEQKREAGLRLDTRDDALAGGDSGQVILAGQPEESRLLQLVRGDDPDSVMPPTGATLDADEIERIRKWIEAGAEWPENADTPAERPTHWAYQPIVRVEPAASAAGQHPIDALLRTRLSEIGIAPSPRADRRTMIRRLSLDLLGLLPSPERVEAFATDESADAYEGLVDELLASPHFGERWGRHWLDIARYADSDGYEKDQPRPDAWRYRDWVIDAINRDLPFDQFTIQQLAGDLLPDATDDDRIATAFHRQTLTNTEGGVDQEEFRVEACFDRVETVAGAWLGLTVGCARCHSHKYDSISQREYYQLFAFFNNADESTIESPTNTASWESYQRQYLAWREETERLQAPLTARRVALQAVFDAWLSSERERLTQSANGDGSGMILSEVTSEGGATLTRLDDGSWLASGTRPNVDVYRLRFPIAPAAVESPPVTGFRLEVLTHDSLPASGPGWADNGNLVLSELTLDILGDEGAASRERLAFSKATADHSQGQFDVSLAIDGIEDTYGWAIGPQQGRDHSATFTLATPLEEARLATTEFEIRLSQQYDMPEYSPHPLGRFRLTVVRGTAETPLPDPLRLALIKPAEERTAAEVEQLFAHFAAGDPEWAQLQQALEAHHKLEPYKPVMNVRVIAERNSNPRETTILRRGSFLEPLEPVTCDTLTVLPPLAMADGDDPTRLDLAHWLMSPDNPLTARVAVNHVWRHLFGQGLVKTVNDFGVRGEPPSHPELLDWLATEYRRVGWSRKRLIRTIVLSETYRQSSAHRPELWETDPENRLLHRQNRFRVDGEIVRDLSLSASGLLQPRIGGPSVFPALPPDIAALSYANNFQWGESEWNTRPDNPHGVPPRDDVHRRGMYTFFKRTAPHPSLTSFDCPDANTTCLERRTSNTPLQALQTLNNEAFLEAAEALASRVRAETHEESSDAERLDRMLRICVSRPGSPDELEALARLLTEAREFYSQAPDRAAELFGESNGGSAEIAEQAAWVVVARVVLNLDEFVTRE